MLELQILTLAVLILFSAFFSGVETAMMSVSNIRVKTLLKQKRRGSKALYRVKQDPHKLIITILIGNNIVNIAAASLATLVFTNMFGSSGVGIATGVMTFLILVFGEITPKTFATQNSERIALLVARPVEILSFVLAPLVKIFELISRGMSTILGSRKEKDLSEEDIKTIVTMGVEKGILNRESAEMMHNILEFEETSVMEIMTPKADVEMVDGNARLKDVLDFVVRTPYSRYPVYIDNTDNIVGILDVDDVLKYVKNNRLNIKVKTAARPVYFVPEFKKIDDLLTEFEGKDTPMAIVVDEYGDVSGLVTIEDILEEIVGEIFDKSKKESRYIKRLSDRLIRVDGKAPVEEVSKIFHLDLKEKHFNTIAGFIEHKLQRIPKKGEKLKLKNVTIEVENVTKQGIKSVKVYKS